MYPIDSEFSGGHYTDHYTDHYPQTSGQDYGGNYACVRGSPIVPLVRNICIFFLPIQLPVIEIGANGKKC